MFRALIIGDDRAVATRVEETLRLAWPDGSFGRLESGAGAIETVHETEPDVVVLDLETATRDGLDTLVAIRRIAVVPVIVIVRGDDRQWLRGVELGADEYLVAPFSPLELLARTKAVVRASESAAREPPSPDAGGPTCLTGPERMLLDRLQARAGDPVTSRSLLVELWGHDNEDRSEFLRVYVRRLREKIERDPDHPRLLLAERGVGYRFARPNYHDQTESDERSSPSPPGRGRR